MLTRLTPKETIEKWLGMGEAIKKQDELCTFLTCAECELENQQSGVCEDIVNVISSGENTRAKELSGCCVFLSHPEYAPLDAPTYFYKKNS